MKSTNYAILTSTKYANAPAMLATSEGVTQEVEAPMRDKSIPNSTTESISCCKCGCGASVPLGRTWVSGHNFKSLIRTDKHKESLSKAASRAWRTKRTRMPIGSTYVNHDGYVVVKVVEGSGQWKLQHVMAAEEIRGRSLEDGEVVHHINGIRSDNRHENLHVFPDKSEHNASHKSFSDLMESLLEDGIVAFNTETGRYER